MKTYYLDRRLTDAEIGRLADDVSQIPPGTKDHLEAYFMAIQDWDFYEGFMVAAFDIHRHLEWPDAQKEDGLRRVQMIAAFILHDAGHLFRDLRLSYPDDHLLEKLRQLPLQVRTFMETLLLDFPCETKGYEDLEKQVPISTGDSMAHRFQLDLSPLFYAGLFHGYYRLYTFFVSAADVPLEAKSDFAMSTAVFLVVSA
jgi:hypothetical protein